MAQRIFPMIAYEDAAAAIDWLTNAFGFSEREGQRYTEEDGTVTHAELEFDAHHARASEARANVIRPPEDSDHAGMRLYTAEDLEGHRWMFGQS
jgi:uncharacterized glyoxalase superfamily protein PhnB